MAVIDSLELNKKKPNFATYFEIGCKINPQNASDLDKDNNNFR